MSVMTVSAAGTDAGRVRARNEDSGYAGRWLHAVADGMGGHAGGQVASATAIRALTACDTQAQPGRLVGTLASAVRDANAAIRRRGEQDPDLRAMGTTLTAMLWSGHTFALAHIGDSRAYRLRDGRLRQLTEDHALRNLVAGTDSSPALGGLISRYLDGRPDRSPDLALHEALPGDRYLLCSDGLSSLVPGTAIRDALDSADTAPRTVRHLISMANALGGPDNITAILIDVSGQPQMTTPTTLGAAQTADHR